MFKATMIAGAGGFIGTCLRFLSELLGGAICHCGFPLGTFMANMVGAFLIGLFYGWLNKTGILSKNMNLFLITGLCGGFTTFSSLSDELEGMLAGGHEGMFWLYLISSLVLGIVLVAVGIACAPRKKTPAAAAA